MARIKHIPATTTHEGAPTVSLSAETELRRTVMASLLWEDNFYESGKSVLDRIQKLIPRCRPEFVAACAYSARSEIHLRHMPLLLVREMARLKTHKHLVGKLLPDVIQRADEIHEFLAIYWKDGKCPISKQVKIGLGMAFRKFNEYGFAKYKGSGPVTLRDVMFMTHPNPNPPNERRYTALERKSGQLFNLNDREMLYGRIAGNILGVPDTWEVRLSSGENKKEVFMDLMNSGSLGGLAFLRNLRNMHEAGVPLKMIEAYSQSVSLERILPFRFIAAAQAAPQYKTMLESMLFRNLEGMPKFDGKTVIVVDNSGSMYCRLSQKSDMLRSSAAQGLAMIGKELCEESLVIGFGSDAKIMPDVHGFKLAGAIEQGPGGGTDTAKAIKLARTQYPDRIILITDEQSMSTIDSVSCKYGYIINVANYQNGIGYKGNWVHIDGWSDAIFKYIHEHEKTNEL